MGDLTDGGREVAVRTRPWRVETRAPGKGAGSDWHRSDQFGAFETDDSAKREVSYWVDRTGSQALWRLVNRDTDEVTAL